MPYVLIYPMFALVVLTFVVGAITLITRINAVRSGKLDARYFKTYNVGVPTDAVTKTQRHFSNLFEVPVLFYSGCLAAMMVGAGGTWPQTWAWLFVAARASHAWIHIGRNKIYPRMASFLFGFVCVMALWLCVVSKVMNG